MPLLLVAVPQLRRSDHPAAQYLSGCIEITGWSSRRVVP